MLLTRGRDDAALDIVGEIFLDLCDALGGIVVRDQVLARLEEGGQVITMVSYQQSTD